MTRQHQEKIKNYIAKLKILDESRFLLGADYHEYFICSTIKHAKIETLKSKYHIDLPLGYEYFLTLIGNGGAGPHYGIHKIEDSLEFATQKKWNLTEPSLLTLDRYCFIPDSDSENELSWMFNSSFPIADSACGGFFFLILNGKKSGEIWKYHGSSKGIIEKKSENFLQWYEKWLSANLMAGVVAEIKNHLMVHGELETISDLYVDVREYFQEKHTCYDDVWMLNLLLPLGDIHAHEALGWLYLCEQNLESSKYYFQHLYCSADEKIKAAGAHGIWAIYMLEGRVDDALKMGEIAVAISKFCLDVERIYELQYALSLTYTVVGMQKEALKAAEELIEIFPIDISFQVLASLHVRFNKKNLAKKSIARLVDNNPTQKFYYGRKFWHIYREIGAEEWSYWVAQITGCKDEKKMLQKTKGKQEELKRILEKKYKKISNFCKEAINSISYIDELDNLIKFASNNHCLIEFETYLLQFAFS